ncbi:MAG: hypothetical protein GTO02_10300 [Candidatus Dadabacteria bacterium]|nr:hypothetical protein [Candidatus Dadabacteria bacterium]
MAIRNGDKPFKIGDIYGCAKVLKIQAYGKDLEECGEGMTAAVTFDRLPSLSIVENKMSQEEYDEFRCLYMH